MSFFRRIEMPASDSREAWFRGRERGYFDGSWDYGAFKS